ncbi:hypothetical protein [Mucilaginibacter lappiensis]|uniref:Uncharacterized protein n=1 Tax=Mucilaginibacter lappiensis TaxID=354630 RepID=A0A841JT89_9SPHI|nr:hypothetical protein [Mucilaginibacter lappiensis]MBB6131495.1 hypothetical protein [Mucilaginibacter lappiensis]
MDPIISEDLIARLTEIRPILAEFQFIERVGSKLKVHWEFGIIPVRFDYAVNLTKGDYIDLCGCPDYPDAIPFFWSGDPKAFQNLGNNSFVVVNRIFSSDINDFGNHRNALRIVLVQDV